MMALARATVAAFEFFEFCDDETLDPDDAVKMMESLSFHLQDSSDEEKAALQIVCQENIDSLNSKQTSLTEEQKSERIVFYEDFLSNLNLNESDE